MLLKREPTEKQLSNSRNMARSRGAAVFRSGAAGAAVGLLGGFLGISGGFIAVPVLVSYQGLEMHRAVATSWMIVAVVSGSATIGHFIAGQRIPFVSTFLFLIGGIIGFEIAVSVARSFSGASLRRLFAAAIFMMSVVTLARLLVR
jgi:uncharacterized membrane protein YfcA